MTFPKVLFGLALVVLLARVGTTLFVSPSPALDPPSDGILEVVNEPNLVGRFVFSGLFGIGALYVILSGKYGKGDRGWAYGTVSTILGYWLLP